MFIKVAVRKTGVISEITGKYMLLNKDNIMK
jgi:hypothetical protein